MCWSSRQTGTATAILAAMAGFTLTRIMESTRITAAGSSAAQCSENSLPNSAVRSGTSPEGAAAAPSPRYTAQESRNGTSADFIMRGMLSNTSVFVSSATSRALVETGEHLSPK